MTSRLTPDLAGDPPCRRPEVAARRDPCILPSVALNETEGVIDTHGGTSHMKPEGMEDLIRFLFTP